MPRFFINKDNISGSQLHITGSDAVHIGRSLRMRLGDDITACCEGVEYNCTIQTISDEMISCNIISSNQSLNEPNINLTLFQAMPKSDKLETIVQKAVELGVCEIYPVITSRCISRPDSKSFKKKRERLEKIALEAAKQSGRGNLPVVHDIIELKEAVKLLSEKDLALICYEKGGKNLKEVGIKANSTVGLFIGSEGGFSQEEVDKCTENGIEVIGLGKRILRCETAPVAAVSIIMNLSDNM